MSLAEALKSMNDKKKKKKQTKAAKLLIDINATLLVRVSLFTCHGLLYDTCMPTLID